MNTPCSSLASLTPRSRMQGDKRSQLISLLQKTQAESGYISREAIEQMSRVSGTPESEIYGVVTFYTQFRLRPPGRHLIRLCDGTACHVNHSKSLLAVIREELALVEPEDTTGDGLFTLQPVACLGCCSLAPVIMIDDETYGRLDPAQVRTILHDVRVRSQTGIESVSANLLSPDGDVPGCRPDGDAFPGLPEQT